jgi:myo-inositol-1(or 4)-monophosphatase
VTEIDIEVEKRMSQMLAQEFPEISFVGEESGGDRTAEKFWLMDPIDGTLHYARGMPFCTSMLALIDRDEVVFSIIYDFIRDEMYWAERGGGAWRNDARLSVSTRGLKEGLMGWETMRKEELDAQRDFALREKTSFFKCVVAGWEYAMVASGKLEGRICFNPWGNDYDYAPGSLLVSEAGGVVANIGSSQYDYRNLNFIASNQVVFSELTDGEGALFPIG